MTSPYEPIAHLFDAWSRSVVEDIPFYVEEGLAAGGTVVELGVGTGRIAIPLARAGVRVIGVDDSPAMLARCREEAEAAGVSEQLELQAGDLRRPLVSERARLVICPFRAYLHLLTEDERRDALAAALALLEPGGRLVFDVFAPDADDIAETDGLWLEREPAIWERADWDATRRTLTLRVRGTGGATAMTLAWVTPDEWRALLEDAGFEIVAHYGWFDRRPYAGGEDSIWVGRRPA